MKKLSTKLLILNITLVIIPSLSILGFISFQDASQALRDQTQKQYRQNVKSLQERIDGTLEERLTALEILKTSDHLVNFVKTGLSKQDFDAEVYNLQRTYGLKFLFPLEGDLVSFGLDAIGEESKKVVDVGIYPSEEFVGLDGMVKQHVYVGGSNEEDFVTPENRRTQLDRSLEVWFQEAKKKNLYISNPQMMPLYLKKYTFTANEVQEEVLEKKLIVIAAPYELENELLEKELFGVLMITTTPDFLDEAIKELTPSEGAAYIFSSQGETITSYQSKGTHEPLDSTWISALWTEGEGLKTYKGQMIAHSKSRLKDWLVVLSVPEKSIYQSIHKLRLKMILTLGLTVILAGLIMTFSVRNLIVKNLKNMETVTESIKGGDLRQEIHITSQDELGRLAESFNTMIISIRELINQTLVSSNQLDSTADSLVIHTSSLASRAETQLLSVERISSAINQINDSIKNVSVDVSTLSSASEETSASMIQMKASVGEVIRVIEDLSHSISDISTAIRQITTSINQVTTNSNSLALLAKDTGSAVNHIDTSIKQVALHAENSKQLALETTQAAKEGQVSVAKTIQGMKEIQLVVLKSAERVHSLRSRSEEIGSILEIINDLAEQTSLLALNASIIAAQAGEHGKGFAVVAEEVKDLAARSSLSAKEIDKLIKTVQDEALRAVEAMKTGSNRVETGVQLADVAGESLKKILNCAERTSSMVTEIAQAAQEQTQHSQNIVQYMDQMMAMISGITNLTEEQKENSHQVSQALERMKQSADLVTKATDEQKKSTNQVVQALDHVTNAIFQIHHRMTEQVRDSEEIVRAIQTIQDAARENLGSTKVVDEITDNLAHQSEALKNMVKVFQV